jgi:hypothetical protein
VDAVQLLFENQQFPFYNLFADTDGPERFVCAPESSGIDTYGSDIWYQITTDPGQSGLISIEACNICSNSGAPCSLDLPCGAGEGDCEFYTDYDNFMDLYSTCDCGAIGDATRIYCNDEGCAQGAAIAGPAMMPSPTIGDTITFNQDSCYTLRVGGWVGDGTFNDWAGNGRITIVVESGGLPTAERPNPLEWTSPNGSVGGACLSDANCSGGSATEAYCIAAADGTFPGSCYAPKNRYLSIAENPDNDGSSTARRITHVESGLQWWLGPWTTTNGVVNSQIQLTPFYADWPPVVEAVDCEVVPGDGSVGMTYQIQAIADGDDVGDESKYSPPLTLMTASTWGDSVSTCFSNNCLAPDGTVGIDDILAEIAAFQGVENGPVTWFDIDPNPVGSVGIGDILGALDGFQGGSYPNDQPEDCN